MILLQVSSDRIAMMVLSLIFRIVGAYVCSRRAKELNRDPGGWGIFGFLIPILAIIWVYCMKPKVVWDEDVDGDNKK